MTSAPGDPARHRIGRVRRETRRRPLRVARVERLSEAMLRLWFEGEELHDFESAGADDHVKLFVPDGDGQAMRDYTPRLFDPGARTLAIDFALHGEEDEEVGPATRWAMAARPGDALEVGGPRGSVIVPDDFDWVLLAGDETAVPAIGRRLEELRPEVPVVAIVSVTAGVERPPLPERANTRLLWAERGGEAAGAEMIAALAPLQLPAGDGFVWIAAEAGAARALRTHMLDARGHPPAWLKASGYWLAGESGTHTTLGD